MPACAAPVLFFKFRTGVTVKSFKPLLFVLLSWQLLSPLSLAVLPPYEALWDSQAVPVLDRYCFRCHAGVRQKSGLDLRSLDTILRGGDHGPSIVPGRADESRLLQYLKPEADPHMPPEGKKQLTPAEIEALRQWVNHLPPTPAADANTNSWVEAYLSDLRSNARPADLPGPETDPAEAIDAILAADWRAEGITPAARCDDRTFVRRICLDLAGRIPAPEEVASFLSSPDENRRGMLVESLLRSPEYAWHFRDLFDLVLLGRPNSRRETARHNNGWTAYLEDAFGRNRPWNEVVRELIVGRSTNTMARGATQYLYERKNNHQAMAEAVAPIAFGVQIGCAQCHNHPLSWEIEQRHYWGLVAAFNRSKNVETSAGIGVAESAIGGFVQFTNLKKESQPAVLAFLNGKTVAEKRPDQNAKETDAPDLYCVAPPKEGQKAETAAVPKFSRREALADAITHENPRLARAFVNRMWQLLLGRGIVHPVDQMDSRHRPSHPELLDWLANDFERHGYDVQRLVRALVSSRAYQLETKTPGRTPPPAPSFARATDKPLTAEQLAASVFVALKGAAGSDAEREELHAALAQKIPELMPAVYNPSLEQALFWSNSPIIDTLLQPKEGSLAAQILALQSKEERFTRAYLGILGRYPEAEEMEAMKGLELSTRPEAGIKSLLWALLSSAEFQLNH